MLDAYTRISVYALFSHRKEHTALQLSLLTLYILGELPISEYIFALICYKIFKRQMYHDPIPIQESVPFCHSFGLWLLLLFGFCVLLEKMLL